MAKIVFIQNLWFECLGTMYLSAELKAHGHDCEVLIGRNAADVLDSIEKYALT